MTPRAILKPFVTLKSVRPAVSAWASKAPDLPYRIAEIIAAIYGAEAQSPDHPALCAVVAVALKENGFQPVWRRRKVWIRIGDKGLAHEC